MEARTVIRLIALGRTALGLLALSLPEIPARPWVGGTDARSTGGRVLARALGSRDLVLGAGTLRAGADPLWALAGAVSDGLDAAVTLGSFRSLPRRGRWQVLAAAGGSALAGAVAARALARR